MNQEKQPRALRLAQSLDDNADLDASEGGNPQVCQLERDAAAELRGLHTENSALRAELVAEAARTAEEKLRADQMTEQHRMQGNLLKEAQSQRQMLADALGECLVASGTVSSEAGCFSGPQLLMFAEDLKGQLSAIGAGGVEALRKRERLQQSAEEVDFILEDLPPVEGLDVILAEYEKTYGRTPDAAMASSVAKVKNMLLMWWGSHREAIAAALQADPPAPAAVAVPAEILDALGMTGGEVDDVVVRIQDMSAARHDAEEARDELATTPAQEHATQLAGQGHEIEIIRQLVEHIERNTCEHHETYRGGAIWEICSGCGAKWADDEGGKPEFQWAESVERARALLLSSNQAHKDEQA